MATFNFGREKGHISVNPTDGLDFMPVEQKIHYIPPIADIEAVIAEAGPDTQDYLLTIQDTMVRVSEINGLKCEEVDLESGQITLFARKKKGGNRTPRVIPMTQRLQKIMKRRLQQQHPLIPWVFWHRYLDMKAEAWKNGPFQHRKSLMRRLCEKAGVRFMHCVIVGLQ